MERIRKDERCGNRLLHVHHDEGRNGFGIWFESQNCEIAKDVESIIGDNAK
jgi:hypothetical protein